MKRRYNRIREEDYPISFKREVAILIFVIFFVGLLIYFLTIKFPVKQVYNMLSIFLFLFVVFCLVILIIKIGKKLLISSKVSNGQKRLLRKKDELDIFDFTKKYIRSVTDHLEYKMAVFLIIIVMLMSLIVPQSRHYLIEPLFLIILLIAAIFLSISNIKSWRKRYVLWKKYHKWLNS